MPVPDPANTTARASRLVEGRWSVGEEEAATLDDAVRKGEAEVGSEELLDVGAADVDGLLDLGNAEDLIASRATESASPCRPMGAAPRRT